MKKISFALLFLVVCAFAIPASALDKTSTGFYYPIGTENFNAACGTWLGRDVNNGGCYGGTTDPGYYHIGVDMMTPSTKSQVYAVSKGEIFHRDCYSNSWGPGNCALFIRHKTSSGQVFTGLYGHLVKESLPARNEVEPGQSIGRTGNWDGGIHLHFGIFMGDSLPASNWGRMSNANWPDQNGFVDPISFLTSNYPESSVTEIESACIGDICWTPRSSSCENADTWYRLLDPPYASYTGSQVCNEIYQAVETIAQAVNHAQEIPEEHWWQSWWRYLKNFFANTVSADDIRQFITVRTIKVMDNTVSSGNGAFVSDTTGSGSQIFPTETPVPDYPDFIVTKLTLTDTAGNERYDWDVAEIPKMHAWVDNIGDADWEGSAEDIDLRFYPSKGYKEDSHSDWVRVGVDNILRTNLELSDDPKHEEEGLNIPYYVSTGYIKPGNVYNIVACADRNADQDNGDGEVIEKHKSNNCSTEAVFQVTGTVGTDFIVHSLQLTNTPIPVPVGGKYAAKFAVKNIGNLKPSTGIRSVYEISGPGTNYQWQFVADDGSDANELSPNVDVWEEIQSLVTAPSVAGIYTLRVRADYQGAVAETNEDNNSTQIQFEIKAQPRIVVTNPTTGDNWRSSNTKHITWNRYDFPTQGNVKIEYSMNGGSTWKTIDSSTANDGSRYWDMCNSPTVDSSNSYIRIKSIEYPIAVGTSNKFTIDHASGCD